MNLTLEPEIVIWPETHYIFVEKIGPFQDTAQQAWMELIKIVPRIEEHNKITGRLSLYKVGPKIYRAGVSVEAATAPQNVPEGLQYQKFDGGRYSRFVLTGPYGELPQATRQVFETVAEKKLSVRDDWGIENYVTDPMTTPMDKNITEILVPVV